MGEAWNKLELRDNGSFRNKQFSLNCKKKERKKNLLLILKKRRKQFILNVKKWTKEIDYLFSKREGDNLF